MRFNLNILLAGLLFLFFAFIVFRYLKPRIKLGKSLSLFRVLFPSWRFFEDLGPVAKLFYRIRDLNSESNSAFGPWLLCIQPRERALSEIFFNPLGNLQMAYHSLVEQTLSDINDQDPKTKADFSNSVSYKLLKNLVEYQIRKNQYQKHQIPLNVLFQFQVLVSVSDTEEYQALLSEEHEA